MVVSLRSSSSSSGSFLIVMLLLMLSIISIKTTTTTNAFVIPPTTKSRKSLSTTILYPAKSSNTPIITEWKVLKNGRVKGTISNHPNIDDGDIITTSPISDPKKCKINSIVITTSGSKYRLSGKPAPSRLNGIFATTKKNGAEAVTETKKPSPVKKKQQQQSTTTTKKTPAVQKLGPISDEKQLKLALAKAQKELNLNGQALGPNGKYLLAGKAKRSTSGKSSIWTCYEAEKDTGMPLGQTPLTIKISLNKEALQRETNNYNKAGGLLGGKGGGSFVAFYDYLSPAGKRPPFSKQCAIVMQQGDLDLKAYLAQNGALEGKPLREAAVAAVQCLQALHKAGLVWTDLKTENFVVLEDEDSGKLSFKGIDLESAMPHKDNPVDYSPEACPPEFAESFLAGEGPYFVLDYSYDIWSLGMMLYEMATGTCMFAKKNPSQITKLLQPDSGWEPSLDTVPDGNLQDLISKCLDMDPKKRPRMTQILLHPYFLTTGFGPLSF